MVTLLVCSGIAFLVGATFGALVALRWVRTADPGDLTVAYLMGREDERKVQAGKKPEVKMPQYITPGEQEWMRQEIRRQGGA